ncbi:hypothetical protein [Streptomyces xiamenensis]|uniref:hypothetical protein n=1 Tax=Streptomyces xiamenensis TaxID=408015 RepID=UPI003D71C595
MNGLEGKVARVTGGSRGIGAAIALRPAAEGAEVAATVAHLAGVDGGYLTGTAVHVDGGFTA